MNITSGLVTSMFGVQEFVRIRPNPTLYRIRPNPESIQTANDAKKIPLRGCPASARIPPNQTLYRIRPNPETPSQLFFESECLAPPAGRCGR